ncbi:UNKNOWN [Stylonychia lemnae]|uniref:Transmembrane protein n=1 Tax=Stylonychia lemnae TaxID=5949 RepID=A0A078AMM4_STYLE|nr:UNKNOWN [Stylonychia lemnae]|eukprot:CDW83404.1 UNKNOWN [Stylonychia lemnae]
MISNNSNRKSNNFYSIIISFALLFNYSICQEQQNSISADSGDPMYIGSYCQSNDECQVSTFCCSETKCVPGSVCYNGQKQSADFCDFNFECLSRCCNKKQCSHFINCVQKCSVNSDCDSECCSFNFCSSSAICSSRKSNGDYCDLDTECIIIIVVASLMTFSLYYFICRKGDTDDNQTNRGRNNVVSEYSQRDDSIDNIQLLTNRSREGSNKRLNKNAININNLAPQGVSFTPRERRTSTPNRERASEKKNRQEGSSSSSSSPTRRKSSNMSLDHQASGASGAAGHHNQF